MCSCVGSQFEQQARYEQPFAQKVSRLGVTLGLTLKLSQSLPFMIVDIDRKDAPLSGVVYQEYCTSGCEAR